MAVGEGETFALLGQRLSRDRAWGVQSVGSAGVLDASSPSGASQRACASMPGTRVPLPAHHGHSSVLGVPPRFEITWPLPRQAIHSRGPWDAGA